MRVLFLGTPAFAVPTLKNLLASRHQVIGVMTRPDRRRERRGRPAPSPVRHAVIETAIPVLQPQGVNSEAVYQEIRALRPDIAVVVAFGSILSETFLEIPGRGCINLHASLLPRLRGAAPIQWAVARGDGETGLTTMQMDAGMDTGDVLLQRATPIGPGETATELAERLALMGGPLVLETLEGLESATVEPCPQDDADASRAPLLRKEDGRIDWGQDAAAIVHRIHGMQPWPIAHARLHDETPLRIFRASPLGAPEQSAEAPPGTVCGVDGDLVLVACGAGLVGVRELQLPSRRRMTGREAVNGRALLAGDRLL